MYKNSNTDIVYKNNTCKMNNWCIEILLWTSSNLTLMFLAIGFPCNYRKFSYEEHPMPQSKEIPAIILLYKCLHVLILYKNTIIQVFTCINIIQKYYNTGAYM